MYKLIIFVLLALLGTVAVSAQSVTITDQTGVYLSGVTYTAGTTSMMEIVTMAGPNDGRHGCRYLLSSTIDSVIGPSQSLTTDPWGFASITFVVPSGTTFSATVTSTSTDAWCVGNPRISNWIEVNLQLP